MPATAMISTLSELTDSMLAHAQRCDWAAVAELESERARIISGLAGAVPTAENTLFMRAALQSMLETNERIRVLATAARLDCLVALDSASTSSRLAKTYGASG